jgi:ribosomal protein L40E
MARKPGDKPNRSGRTAAPVPAVPDQTAGGIPGLQPWHLLALGTMAAMTAGAFFTTGTPVVNVVFVIVAIATVALAAIGLYRTLMPLATPDAGEQTDMLGGRTRAALEREKMLVLRSIKEVEFDRAMRKISDADYQEMVGRLRSRAAGLLRQLDGGGLGYRELIERDLATRLGSGEGSAPVAPAVPERQAPGVCRACGADNGVDARFCKSCGTRVGEAS